MPRLLYILPRNFQRVMCPLSFLRFWLVIGGCALLVAGAGCGETQHGSPLLHRKIPVPSELLSEDGYMGDLRIGDLGGNGDVEFVLLRSQDENMKPTFLAAFAQDGTILWKHGTRGQQPARPGPEMVIGYSDHHRDAMLVGNSGSILSRYLLNPSPNSTGMMDVRWNGDNGADLLYNGGLL